MALPPEASRSGERLEKPRRSGVMEDLLTGLSLVVFLVLMVCVLAGAWLYESGV